MAVSRIIQLVILALLALLLTTTGAVADTPVGTKFTYQGRLTDGGKPANAIYDFEFALFDALTTGNQEGGLVKFADVTVTNGLFTVILDFGSTVFKGDARWLSIKVRPGASTGAFTQLSPRQPINTTPYAVSSAWTGLSGVPAGFADNTDNDTTYSAGAGLVLNGTSFALNTTGLSNNKVVKYNSISGNLVNSQISDDGTRIYVGTKPSVIDYLLGVSSGAVSNTLRVHNTNPNGVSAIIGSSSGAGGTLHLGLEGLASGAVSNRAVSGTATTSGATVNMGGFFQASGATNNWAIYANVGNVAINDKLGIGDTTPDAKLDVRGTAASDGILIDNIASNGDPILGFQLSGFGKFTMGVDDSDGDKFKIGTTAITTNTRLTIESNGEVGIGTTSPSQKLHVSGNTYISGKLGVGKTPISTVDVNGDLKVRDSITVTATSGSLGHVTADPVAGHWLYGSTSTTASGFANLVAQMENTDTSYLGYVLNRNYIEIKKSGWYHVFVDVLKIGITGTENGSVELRRYGSTGIRIADMCRGFSGGGSGSGYVMMSCSGIDFFSAGNRVQLFDESSGSGIVGSSSSTNRLSSLKIIKLN